MPSDLSPLWISLKTALFSTIITFVIGVAVAYWMLNYRGNKIFLEGILISPLILPPTVVGFILLLLLGKNGVIGRSLISLNVSVVFSWYGAVIAAIVVSFPLMYRTTLGAFEHVDVNFLHVARTLGASEWTIFRRILLPLSLPGILAGTMLTFARALGEFGATLMLAGNIPGETQTIPMAIYFAVEAGATGEAAFWTIVILCISLSGIFALNVWQSRQQIGMRRSDRVVFAPINTSHSFDSSLLSSALWVEIQKPLSDFDLKVSFSVNQDPIGILGRSGAGKTMVLRCIAGVETPIQGKIVLNGRVLFDSNRGINLPSRDRRIGFMVQNYALFPHMTVAQNIAFGLPKSLDVRQQVHLQLAALQLQGFGDRYPHQLSGGQQQRVALARALASQPEALLLDEPFSALDTFLRSQIEQQMITRLATYSGVTLLVTHNLEEAYRVCPNLLVLDRGQVVAQGAKHLIFDHPETYTVAQLTGCKNFACAIAVSATQVDAIEWGIRLTIAEPIPKSLAYIGIRAHQITFLDLSTRVDRESNCFICWLVKTSETPHRMTVFLKFNAPPTHAEDYHLQAEVFKETWSIVNQRSLPWSVRLDRSRLILMTA